MKAASWPAAVVAALAMLRLPAAANPPASAASASAILDRWVAAEGGIQAVLDLQSLQYDLTIDLPTGSPWRIHWIQSTHNRYRWESVDPRWGNLVQASDGRHSWMRSSQLGFGQVSLEQTPLAFIRSDQLWNSWRIEDYYRDISVLPDVTCNGRPCHRLLMTNTAGIPEFWSFDAVSGQLVRVESTVPRLARIEVDYSDFRSSGPLTLPYFIECHYGAVRVGLHRANVRVDDFVDDLVFSPTKAELDRASDLDAVVNRAIDALGGNEAVHGVRTRVLNMTVEVAPTGVRYRSTITRELPDRVLVETQYPGIGTQIEGFDGHIGWSLSDIQGYRELKPEETAQLRTQGDLSLTALLLANSPLRRDLGLAPVGEHIARAVALATPFSSSGIFYFDQDTGLPLRQANLVLQAGSDRQKVDVDYDDYRLTDGLMVPYRITLATAATRTVCRIDSIKDNVPVAPDAFAPRTDVP